MRDQIKERYWIMWRLAPLLPLMQQSISLPLKALISKFNWLSCHLYFSMETSTNCVHNFVSWDFVLPEFPASSWAPMLLKLTTQNSRSSLKYLTFLQKENNIVDFVKSGIVLEKSCVFYKHMELKETTPWNQWLIVGLLKNSVNKTLYVYSLLIVVELGPEF